MTSGSIYLDANIITKVSVEPLTVHHRDIIKERT